MPSPVWQPSLKKASPLTQKNWLVGVSVTECSSPFRFETVVQWNSLVHALSGSDQSWEAVCCVLPGLKVSVWLGFADKEGFSCVLASYSNAQSDAAVPLKLYEFFLPINTYFLSAEKKRSPQTFLCRMNAYDGVTFTNHSAPQNEIIKLTTGTVP